MQSLASTFARLLLGPGERQQEALLGGQKASPSFMVKSMSAAGTGARCRRRLITCMSTRDSPRDSASADRCPVRGTLSIAIRWAESVTITLNGEAFELSGPLTVAELLSRLEIDARRVAVEHNITVLKRAAFDQTMVRAGDQVEIVNFVGGG